MRFIVSTRNLFCAKYREKKSKFVMGVLHSSNGQTIERRENNKKNIRLCFFPSLFRFLKRSCWIEWKRRRMKESEPPVHLSIRKTALHGMKYAENRKSNNEWKASGTQHTNNNIVSLKTISVCVCVFVCYSSVAFSEQSKRNENNNNKNNDGGKKTFVFVKCMHSIV